MRARSNTGSVALVALCFIAVLGIGLAGYLGVSTQAMRLSNRAYAKDTSRHLAEMGIEQVLRSYNSGSFSGWTISGTTATRTLSTGSTPALPTLSNSGIVPSVYLRVDRYNARIWSAATSYAANDMVWYRGVWFHCKAANTNRVPPDSTYWISAPSKWNADAYYNSTGTDIVVYGENSYRCTTAHSNQIPGGSNWSSGYSASAWNAASSYAVDDVVVSGGIPYRCIAANTNQAPPNLSYWISAPVIYSEGVALLPDNSSTQIKTQLCASLAPAPLFPNAAAATNTLTLASGGTVDSYNSPTAAYAAGSAGFAAVLAGGDTSTWAVSVTTPTIKGFVAAPASSTSPYDPWAQFGTNTVVNLRNPDGSVTSARSGSANVDNTRISRSPYIPQFDIQSVTGTVTPLPAPAIGATTLNNGVITLGVAPVPGTASTPIIYNVTSTYSAAAGGYFSGLLLYDSGNEIIINGPVILNVTGTYFGPYNGKITINTGGSLEIYFSASTRMYFSNASGSGIDNKTLDPSKLLIASTHTNTTLNFHYFQLNSSALPFYGTLYMPNAFVTVVSSAQNYGAISARYIRFSSNANLHYDTNLRTVGRNSTYTGNGGIDSPFLITQWRELTSVSERVTLP